MAKEEPETLRGAPEQGREQNEDTEIITHKYCMIRNDEHLVHTMEGIVASIACYPKRNTKNGRQKELTGAGREKEKTSGEYSTVTKVNLDIQFRGIMNCTRIPDEFYGLSNISSLRFSKCTCKLFRKANGYFFDKRILKNRQHLRHLEISFASLGHVNPLLLCLSGLQELNLSHNTLAHIPSSLLNELPDLRILSLEFNSLSSLPDSLFPVWCLCSSSNSSFGYDESKDHDTKGEFPPLSRYSVGKDSHLWQRIVYISNNLTHLNLAGNQLQSLPNSLGFLDQLEWLDVSNNVLKSLPYSIGCLRNLNFLNAANNSLGFLPSGLVSVKEEHRARKNIELRLDGNTPLAPTVAGLEDIEEPGQNRVLYIQHQDTCAPLVSGLSVHLERLSLVHLLPVPDGSDEEAHPSHSYLYTFANNVPPSNSSQLLSLSELSARCLFNDCSNTNNNPHSLTSSHSSSHKNADILTDRNDNQDFSIQPQQRTKELWKLPTDTLHALRLLQTHCTNCKTVFFSGGFQYIVISNSLGTTPQKGNHLVAIGQGGLVFPVLHRACSLACIKTMHHLPPSSS